MFSSIPRSAALEGAEVWLCEALPLMRHVCREVVAANSGLVAEKRGTGGTGGLGSLWIPWVDPSMR